MQPGAYVFDEAYCDQIIEQSKDNGTDFRYTPKLICVGKQKRLSYEFFFTEDLDEDGNWVKIDNQFLENNPQIVKAVYKKNMIDPDGNQFYETAIGSCQGDSGGPIFIKGFVFKAYINHR